MKNKVIVIIISLIMLVTIGVTYAYFSSNVGGNESKFNISSKEINVILTDTTIISDLSITPGWSNSKTFTVENKSSGSYNYNIIFENLLNTFVTDGSLQYKITSTNGGYNMIDWKDVPKNNPASDVILAYSVDIEKGVTQNYTIEFRYYDNPDVDQSADIGKDFSGSIAIAEGTNDPNWRTLYAILTDENIYEQGVRTDFSTPFGGTELTQGYNQEGKIYKVDNDYYFAGNPSDNWVYFAGFYWRIIRTKKGEGTRLLYAGTSHDGQDGYINGTTYQWYEKTDDYKYVEWSYAQDTIGNVLTDWYNNNITGTNANMVNTNAIYCNDTSVASTSGSNIYYGAYGRLNTNKLPSYACNSNGNSTHKTVGLMTADEVAFAGGVYVNNAPNTYYYRNSIVNGCTGSSRDTCSVIGENRWWTMNPWGFHNNDANTFFVYGSSNLGSLSGGTIDHLYVVRPVITLKSNVLVTSGTGTAEDPFIVGLGKEDSNTKYSVTLTASNATIDNDTKETTKNGSVSFNVIPNDTYAILKVTCNNGASGSISNNEITISNVTGDNICEVEVSKKKYNVIVTSNNDTMGTVSPTNQSVEIGSNAIVTINPKEGYAYKSNTCGLEVTNNQMIFNNVQENKNCEVVFEGLKNLYATLSNGSKYTIGTVSSFAGAGGEISQGYTSTGKIYKTGNDYYFRENTSDNWAKFAGYWWRIIRTNSSEGTRLLYAGTSHDGQDGYINGTGYRWYDNSSYDQPYHVKWNYANNTIGSVLNSWYDSNIKNYENMVNTNVVYCNDISQTTIAEYHIKYGAYNRLVDAKTPTYSCSSNGNITHTKIGLMTADEVAFAGGAYQFKNLNTYYYRNSISSGCTGENGDPCSVTGNASWWTMSPAYFVSGSADVYCVGGAINYGTLDSSRVTSSLVVRPVIALKPNVLVSGSGTTDDPYIPVGLSS